MSTVELGTLKIGFIGGGNMARSLIGGLLRRGAKSALITVSDPTATQLELLKTQFGVHVTANNDEVAQRCDVVILAVKPQDLPQVAAALHCNESDKPPIIISIAAGVRASDLQRWLRGTPVIRCMPNRPALQGCGVSGMYAPPEISADAKAIAAGILGAVGPVVWVSEERQMDAVTAVSGSGPAYFFLLVEMLEHAGVKLGLPLDVSHRLAVETAYGAGVMCRDSDVAAAVLRQQVTSKGGTTEAALNILESSGVRDIFTAAITAAAQRSAQLAEQLGAAGTS